MYALKISGQSVSNSSCCKPQLSNLAGILTKHSALDVHAVRLGIVSSPFWRTCQEDGLESFQLPRYSLFRHLDSHFFAKPNGFIYRTTGEIHQQLKAVIPTSCPKPLLPFSTCLVLCLLLTSSFHYMFKELSNKRNSRKSKATRSLIYADFSKDQVVLQSANSLSNLSYSNFYSNLLSSIEAHLLDRSCRLVLGSMNSHTFGATSGVSRGSILVRFF